MKTVIHRYDHGGARVYLENGEIKDLVVDIYSCEGDDPAERRERIIAALVRAGIIEVEGIAPQRSIQWS